MARRKQKRPKRARRPQANLRVWEPDERLELLAYLNYCVLYEVDFRSTVIQHLKNVTGKEFSARQIRDRLKREWENYGKCERCEDLYTQGTAALNSHEEEDQIIAQKFARLEPPDIRHRLRSASSAPNSRSRTLSTAVSGQGASRSRSFQRSSEDPLSTMQTYASNNDSKNEPSHERIAASVKGESDSEPSSMLSIDPEISDSTIVARCLPVEVHTRVDAGVQTEAPQIELMEAELLKQKACVFTLKSQLFELRKQLEVVHKSSRATVKAEDKLRQQVSFLKARLEAKSRLLDDTVASKAGRLGLSDHATKQQYDLLYHEINDSCTYICDMNPDYTLPQDTRGSTILTDIWATKASSLKLEELLRYCFNHRIHKETLFTCLVATAVFELVFEPVFPEILALESPLLQQYRKKIMIKDGRQALHQLDMIALKSLTSEDHFQTEVLPEKAKAHSEFIFRNLQVFLHPESKDLLERPLKHEKEFLGVASLAKTISHALKLKINLGLSLKTLRFYFFKPGDEFDQTSMQKIELQTTDENNGMMTESNIVRLCLLPALYAIPMTRNDEELESLETWSNADHNHHLKEAREEDLESFVILAKAVVAV